MAFKKYKIKEEEFNHLRKRQKTTNIQRLCGEN